MIQGLFITGTDTNVGKTFLTARIARDLRDDGVRAGIYKPACSGSTHAPGETESWEDVETHFHALGGRFPRERICPQCFRAPLAPPVAASAEGRTVDEALLRQGVDWWAGRADVLLLEGAGGFLCPISRNMLVADLAVDLAWPVLIVARLGLGTINHTLMTIESIRSRGLIVAGVVLNDTVGPPHSDAERTNPGLLAQWTNAPILGVLPHNESGGLRDSDHPIRIRWSAFLRQLAEGAGR